MTMKIEATWIDRAIAVVAPAAASRRMAARWRFTALTGGGYTGARKTRRATQTWKPSGGSANADIIPDLPALRDRSRDLVRNTPVATAVIGRSAVNVVGTGLRVSPQIDRTRLGLDEDAAEAWEREAEFLFRCWARSSDCDASRVQNFYGLQDLVFRAVLESGDCFAVPAYGEAGDTGSAFRLRLYEADQVSTPTGAGREGSDTAAGRIFDGVEIDAAGAPLAYHFAARHPGDISGRPGTKWARVAARGEESGERLVWHIHDRRRIGQTRGVPVLAPVIETLKQLADYTEAELMAAVIGAMITVVYKGKGGGEIPPNDPDDPSYSATSGDASARELKMASGTVMELDVGDDVSVPPLGRPNSGFDPFFVAMVRQIGASLNIPFEVLVMHFTASYSASRAALEMAWQTFRAHRAWLAGALCQPAYETRIAEAVATGQLAAPGFFADPLVRAAYLGTEWIGPRRISLDPKKENEADEIAERHGWKTDSEITAEMSGGNWERKNEQRARERRQRAARGLPEPGASAPASPVVPEADPDKEESEE